MVTDRESRNAAQLSSWVRVMVADFAPQFNVGAGDSIIILYYNFHGNLYFYPKIHFTATSFPVYLTKTMQINDLSPSFRGMSPACMRTLSATCFVTTSSTISIPFIFPSFPIIIRIILSPFIL